MILTELSEEQKSRVDQALTYGTRKVSYCEVKLHCLAAVLLDDDASDNLKTRKTCDRMVDRMIEDIRSISPLGAEWVRYPSLRIVDDPMTKNRVIDICAVYFALAEKPAS
jgi:hypothetical protein